MGSRFGLPVQLAVLLHLVSLFFQFLFHEFSSKEKFSLIRFGVAVLCLAFLDILGPRAVDMRFPSVLKRQRVVCLPGLHLPELSWGLDFEDTTGPCSCCEGPSIVVEPRLCTLRIIQLHSCFV